MTSLGAGDKTIPEFPDGRGSPLNRTKRRKEPSNPNEQQVNTKTFYTGFWHLVHCLVISLYNESQTSKCCVCPFKGLASLEHCVLTDPCPSYVVTQLPSGGAGRGASGPESPIFLQKETREMGLCLIIKSCLRLEMSFLSSMQFSSSEDSRKPSLGHLGPP